MQKAPRQALGKTQKKILLAISGFVALGYASSPRQQARAFRALRDAWRTIDSSEDNKIRAVRALSKRGYLQINAGDELLQAKLTKNGVSLCEKLSIEATTIPRMSRWDGQWRILMTDIPERRKKGREALRYHLRRLGFLELQKSVWIHPFECESEVRSVLQFHRLSQYAQLAIACRITNEDRFRKYFHL